MTERDKYLKTVKRQLKKAGDQDGDYLAVLCQEVDTYCVEHTLATAEDLRDSFGDPSMHVAEFLRNVPEGFAQQKIVLRKRLFVFVKVILAILAAAVVILLSIHVADTWSYTHGQEEYSDAQLGSVESDPQALETH